MLLEVFRNSLNLIPWKMYVDVLLPNRFRTRALKYEQNILEVLPLIFTDVNFLTLK